jgi:PAS domain S-box-containing protein
MATHLDETRGAMTAPDAARAVFDHAACGMAVLDDAGAVMQSNAALQQLLGLDADALVGRSLTSLVAPADRDTCVAALDALVADGTHLKLDLRLAAREHEGGDGSGDIDAGDAERWARVHLSRGPTRGAGASPLVGTFEDVTDEKKADAAAQITHKRLEQIFEQANDIIFNIDMMGRFTWGNPVGAKLVKRPLDEIIGMNFIDLVRPGYRRAAAKFYQHQILNKIPSTYYEYPVVASDGEVIWLGQHVQLILEDGRIANIQAVARDITARKKAEDALRESEERLHAVVSNAPIILWACDRDGVLTLCEGHGLEQLGVAPGDLVGRKLAEVYTSTNSEAVTRDLQRALEGETFQREVPVGDRAFDSWFAPLRDTRGDTIAVMGVAVDITERVHLSEQLRDAEKIEAIGRLAGGVAHDFNNQLTAILGFAEMLQQSFDPDDERSDDVEQILKGGRRAADLTEQLLAFGRKQPRRLTVVDLNAVITDLEPLLVHSIREDVHFDTKLAEHLRPVTADEGQIEQVIMNLTLNSRDAMPAGGQLTIETANVTLDAAQLEDHAPLEPGPYTVVSVTDTGDGIDDDTKAHLFEPFFTTKEPGKGTGMGLASAYGIIKQSDGFIKVTSEVGHGSTFAFYLPSTTAETPAPQPVSTLTGATPPGGSETILFVEDNVAVREMTAAALTGAGYTVLQASSVAEALSVASHHDGSIALLVTDVVMPVRGGRELAVELSAMRPDLMVLFVTAYPGDPSLSGAFDATHEVLEKPFGPKDLLRRVRMLLDRAISPTPETARQT